jgi:two-component system, cell cycle sensor histidine kinase and response regulator CckA
MTEGKRARILVVDDEEIIRSMACALLGMGGYDAESASSGDEAVRRISSGDFFDIIILDLSMPGMSGPDAFKAIRSASPGARILISSGYGVNGSVQELFGSGATGFIQKPYFKVELFAAIERALEN